MATIKKYFYVIRENEESISEQIHDDLHAN
jgi:hypothetical protein